MSRTMISVIALLTLLLINSMLVPYALADTPPTAVDSSQVAFQDDGSGEDTPSDPPPDDAPPADPTSSLFEGIGAIFAVLGVYVVTMFTMAIGTEISVDVLKGILGKPLGLNSQPTARKTLQEYKAYLPGTLEDLGLSAEAKLRLEKQVSDLEKLLTPAFVAEEFTFHLRHKEFSEALAVLGADQIGAELIDDAKGIVKAQLETAVAQIDATTTLGQAVQVALKRSSLPEKADRAIDRLARRAGSVTPEQLYAAAETVVRGEIAEGVTTWAKAYMNSLQEESYETAVSIYQNQLKPQIAAFGLGGKTQAQLEAQFERFLVNLKTYRGTDILLDSLNNVLVDLETQRNALRSSIGKMRDRIIAWFKRVLLRSPMQHPSLEPNTYDPRIHDSSEAAGKLIDLEQQDKIREAKRIRRLRLVSVLFGTLLAYALQIDSADLLRDLFPPDANFLAVTLIRADSALFTWFGSTFRINMFDLTGGVILTGLAASAGSSFWHDQLGRLRNVKQGVDAAEQALRPIIIQAQQIQDDA